MEMMGPQTPESTSGKALRRAKNELKEQFKRHPYSDKMNFGIRVTGGTESIIIYWLGNKPPPSDLPKEHGVYPVQVKHMRPAKGAVCTT